MEKLWEQKFVTLLLADFKKNVTMSDLQTGFNNFAEEVITQFNELHNPIIIYRELINTLITIEVIEKHHEKKIFLKRYIAKKQYYF